jgi:hypothetical protein
MSITLQTHTFVQAEGRIGKGITKVRNSYFSCVFLPPGREEGTEGFEDVKNQSSFFVFLYQVCLFVRGTAVILWHGG